MNKVDPELFGLAVEMSVDGILIGDVNSNITYVNDAVLKMFGGLGGLGGMDPKKMQAMMKQLGMSQEEIDAIRVIIEKTDGGKIVIENPNVSKISVQGQESFQIVGDIKEESGFQISEEDIKTIMEKTGSTEKDARNALEETKDIADAILKLS